jgi:DNA polymerase elongation subunit (family B)
MAFYTNVFQRGDKIYVRGYDMGIRFTDCVDYKPYLFMLNGKANGDYKTLDGRNVSKIPFSSISEARKHLEQYKDVVNSDVYGLTTFPYLYIYDNFKGDIDYDPEKIRVGILDIECAADKGFPDIELADKPLTAITIRCLNRNYVFGCGEFNTDDPNTYYFQCEDEYVLITKFLNCWMALDLDIVTGWNIEFFDIPYLVNRITKLFNDKEAKKLSPWRFLSEKKVEFRGKFNQSFSPLGIAVVDYYQLYRKFSFSNQPSYKLDYISQLELGEKKIDYSEYGNLLELYKSNHQKFIEYNIHDCVLVERLDDKLKFMEQIMALAYDAKVNYNDTMTTVRPWDIIIHNYLLEQGIVVPPIKVNTMNETLVGGYVKEPKIGLSNWVVSFDLNSLYPHLIMQYNISPETFVRRDNDFYSIDQLLNSDFKIRKTDDTGNGEVAFAANGCQYRRDKQGFLPALMERMYNDRTKYKKLMLEAKQRYEKSPNQEDEKLIARYHNMQMAKKIQLNSAYGALGNQYFRWFNFDHAEAITMSGQLSIRWIEKKMNEFMNKAMKTEGKDYVIASDTDSIYVEMKELVSNAFLGEEHDELKIVNAIDQFCNEKIQPYIDKCYQELADCMNAYQQKMQMKRETIANKGIWKAKKMYILNAWNIEGVQFNEPKLKMQGIEAVRSSTPQACRDNIKSALKIIMNSREDNLQKFIKDFKDEFMNLSFEDIAFPRGVQGMSKYYGHKDIYIKHTPIHVKGALLFNHWLKRLNITNIPPISDGDKIKFAYLKTPNPIHDSVIATPDVLPKEFNLDKYVDREMQFEKSFMEPLRSITDVIGWKTEKRSTLESLFG